jgi:TPR repeat protein
MARSNIRVQLSGRSRTALAFALAGMLAWQAVPCYADGLQEARRAARARDFKRTAEILAPLAEAGNVEAQVTLAGLYRAGRGVEKNQYQLAVMHENGWGTAKDPGEAEKWFTAAVRQGHTMAREKLARMSKNSAPPMDQRLLAAARAGRIEELDRLLAQGASGNAKDTQGRTAMFLAAMNHHFEAASRLLATGAGIDIPNASGDTALLHLTRQGHAEGAARLLAMGANGRIENHRGESALKLAEASGDEPLRSLFATVESLKAAREAARARDFKRTAEILAPLAEAGNVEAQVTLAGLYRAGRGVEKNSPPGRATPTRSTSSPSCMKTAGAPPRTLAKRRSGSPPPPARATPWPRPETAPSTLPAPPASLRGG